MKTELIEKKKINKRIDKEAANRTTAIDELSTDIDELSTDIDELKDRLSTISSESYDTIKSQSKGNKISQSKGNKIPESEGNKINARSSINELSMSVDMLKDRLSTISSESDDRFETQNFINTKMVEIINNFHKKIKKTPLGAFIN